MIKTQNQNNKDIITLAKYIFTKLLETSHCDSHLFLQRLLFIIRWNEVKNNQLSGCFDENNNFQAWIYGPTSKIVYDFFVPFFMKEQEKEFFMMIDKKEFKKYDKQYGPIINKYLSENWSANDIIRYTQGNKAYQLARTGYKKDEPCENYINELSEAFKTMPDIITEAELYYS